MLYLIRPTRYLDKGTKLLVLSIHNIISINPDWGCPESFEESTLNAPYSNPLIE